MTARPEFDPLDLLLIDYFELALDDARMRELSSLLAADPSARRRYIERSMIHSLLEWRSGGVAWSIDDNFHLPSPDDLGHAMVLPAIRGTDENDFESTEALNHLPLNNRAADVAPQNRSPRWLVKWWLIIAASFLLAVGVWALLLVRQDAKTSASAATIVGTEQAHWAHDQYAITNGTDIAVGRPISLESGWAELRLTSGTDMVVNGPAQLSINGPSLIHLSFGKLGISAAPLSHGLTVETRDARIRDLGTEFGVECEAGGKTVVEVFKGTVEASPVGSLNASLLLYTGDGARISNSAISRRPADAQPASFVLHLADQVMPADFSQFDVGQPSLPGSAQYHPDTDSWTISGNGKEIFYTADQFHFVAKHLEGDVTVTVGVASPPVEFDGGTHGNSKCGLMVRQSLSPASPFAAVAYTEALGVQFFVRESKGEQAHMVGPYSIHTRMPVRLRLTRSGNDFAGYYSGDGATWTLIGTRSVKIGESTNVGMVVSSASGRMASTTFTNFTLVPGAPQ